ncbi:MAG: TetR/AcrR family transcriptional regulator [Actinomycetota bacterium]|nr:TetR/AcrR family transcriptional regulator [Actinomycetota bacterium]
MSIPYEMKGRRKQKARTRSALIEATRQLLGEGLTPTVEQAAQRAEVARTTAYRYFANQNELLIATYPELDEPSLLGVDPPSDPSARLKIVTERLTQQVVDHEPELRATLRLALGPDAPKNDEMPLRQGRGIYWIEDALTPLRGHLSETEIRRLVLAIRATIGIEALVWLTDVGGLPRAEAVATMRWSAKALLRSALEDVPARQQLE